MMLVFGYGLLFAEKISSIEPSEVSVRYRRLSQLFYENEELVFTISLLLCFLLIVLLNLIRKLLEKEFLIIKDNNKISFGNNQIGNIDNIQSIQIINHKYNSWIYMYLKDTSEVLDSKRSIHKMIYSIYFYFNKNALSINVSLFKGGSSENLEKIREIIGSSKRKKNRKSKL